MRYATNDSQGLKSLQNIRIPKRIFLYTQTNLLVLGVFPRLHLMGVKPIYFGEHSESIKLFFFGSNAT
jgi:hypothetical protein